MASFTETATLKVVDQSSAQISKINAALKKLFATANALKSKTIDLKINAGSIDKTSAKIKQLTSDLKGLKAAQIVVRANTAQATAAINRVRQQASKPVSMRVLGAAAGLYGTAGAARAVGRQAVQGTKGADLGNVNLDMLQLSKERRDLVDKQVKAEEARLKALPGPYQFNTGMVQQRMAENLREVREGEAAKAFRVPVDPNKPWITRAATAAEMQAESQHRIRVAGERTYQEIVSADQIAKDTGVSATQALEKIKGYYKALDMAGQLSDEAGNNSVQRIQEAGDFIRRMRGAIGEEATGQFLATLVRREKAAKYALTPQGQLAVAFVAEDMGPSAAGTAFSTWQNQVQGARLTTAARQAQVKAGLATGGRFEGKGKNKRYVADTVDAMLAQTDPLAYARKRYVPALKSMGMTEEQIFSNAPEDVATLTNNFRKLYSETNAANFAITMMTKLLELESKTRDAATRDATPAVMAEASKNSIQAATNSLQSAFQGIFGQAAVAIAPYATPIADAVSSFMSDIAANAQAAGKGDTQAMAKLAAGAVGGIVAGGAGLLALKAMAPTLGLVGGAQAMMHKDPTVAALGAATVAMTASASAQMAASVSMAGGLGKLLALMGPAGAALGLASVVMGGTPGAPVPVELANATPAERERIYARDAAKYQLMKAKEALKAFDEGKLYVQPPESGAEKNRTKNRAQIEKDKLRLAKLRADQVKLIADLEAKVAEYEATKPPPAETATATKAAAKAEADAAAAKEEAEKEAAKNRTPSQQAALEEAKKAEAAARAAIAAATSPSEETAKIEAAKARAAAAKAEADALEKQAKTPVVKEPIKEEAAKPVDPLATLIPQLTASSNSIQVAATSLSSTTGLFAAAFSTGATQIAAAGQTAADAISAGASSAGAAYGAAAAAQISAAVANVSINVKHSGGGGDTGNINNANGNK